MKKQCKNCSKKKCSKEESGGWFSSNYAKDYCEARIAETLGEPTFWAGYHLHGAYAFNKYTGEKVPVKYARLDFGPNENGDCPYFRKK